MRTTVQEALQTAMLMLASAALFAVFFQFNAWIFSALEYRSGINWVFLPSGFRVILVLILGLPGAVGIMLGTWYIDRMDLSNEFIWLALCNGLVSGWTPWLTLKWFEKRKMISLHLNDMTVQQLLNFTMVYAAANALAHHGIWLLLHRVNINGWVDVWPMFVGDMTGALLMLYAWKLLLKFVKQGLPLPKK
ncbi:hypothetical protein B9Z51_03695 [Limnohabitans sp. T6-5]|uniref:hypothetical protein n=1 Tax=Limnohabitans sp. T6-5 TaxID=1100724 RepID=UPI000D388509|nr:hypothetical protein [Limnohabitans sp. T6-5]PUE11412.1 hypothetical protein B9Z51_03695 [Limnohabitans sp. T6-5]